jgi:dUTPase
MSKVVFYIDTEKVKSDTIEKGWIITPHNPVVKTTGLFGDAGIDLFAAYDFVIPPHSYKIVNSYIGVLFDAGVAGLLFPRGGDLFLLGSGVIDTGYTGSIRSKIINPYAEEMIFKAGDSIGQLVLFTKASVDGYTLNEIDQNQVNIVTERGKDGRIVNQFTL